jgi:radical SAM superfamily enzyme YgiQ (UPF0313 family)
MRRNPEIDFGVVSNGEVAIIDLLKNLDHPESVKNLVFRKNGRIHFTGIEAVEELDSLPSPSRDGFDILKYKESHYSMGIESKRGCGFRCTYCLYPHLQGCGVLLRSPKKVVDEIEDLVDKWDIRHFFFADPIFNFPFDHGRKICQEIIKRNLKIKWRAWFRPDFINAKFMVEAVKSGCDIFDFSPDGASNEAMEILGKNMQVKDIEKAINLVHETEDAKVGFNFMYDLPRANMQQIIGLTRIFSHIMQKCGDKLQYLGVTRVRIYPHTPIYKIALSEGKINANTDLIQPVYYRSRSSEIQNLYVSFINWLTSIHIRKASGAQSS